MHKILHANEKNSAEMTVTKERRVGSASSRGDSEGKACRKGVNDYRCRRIASARARDGLRRHRAYTPTLARVAMAARDAAALYRDAGARRR